MVQFQQSLFTAKVSYHTVIGYSATTICDRVTEACNNSEKRVKKTETAKQSTCIHELQDEAKVYWKSRQGSDS